MQIEVNVLREAGYEQALYGLSLSFKDSEIPFSVWWTAERIKRSEEKARVLASQDGGHNKFLESIVVWLDINAPRYWWQEFDTYRVGVTKQSESTMHTMNKRPLTADDFEGGISDSALAEINTAIYCYNDRKDTQSFVILKGLLPEGFMQRRVVCLNYKALRNIILQRRNHRLPHWHEFIKCVVEDVEHPELLPIGTGMEE